MGERAENIFILLAVKLGWKISASTNKQNIDEHWDYLIEKEDQSFRVEVKSRKRISRSEDKLQSEFTWIELHGVRSKDAVYKVYSRDGRKDKLTLLPMPAIEAITFMEWQKDNAHEKIP